MFGYVICCRESLSEEERERYQEIYCGLCRTLRERFGQLSGFTLNYDMTFLALFLMSLYEPEEERSAFRCPCHPFHKRTQTVSCFAEYAADMTIALSYYKCVDDWKDERKYTGRAYGAYLKKSYERVKARYPRQCGAIAGNLESLDTIEKNPDLPVDEAVKCSGRMLSELFVYREDFWSESLRQFGYELGRFIYLMDAAVDYEKDQKTGNYNPLLRLGKTPAQMEDVLNLIMGNAAAVFEKLPMVQDTHLLCNIIYAGVWQKYNAMVKKKQSGSGEEKGEYHG